MKTYILIAMLALTGCSTTVPVKMTFPDVPPSLQEKCAPLKKIQGERITIVDLHKAVVENYTAYHVCAMKQDEWNEWYNTQKKIYESVK
jgi:hypothetical protein